MNVITNDQLLSALQVCKDEHNITVEFADMLLLICSRLANKPEHIHCIYKESMIRYAWEVACMNWHTFDSTKSNNAFAYFHTMIIICFNQYIKLYNMDPNQLNLLLKYINEH
jgi:hypothetical protein